MQEIIPIENIQDQLTMGKVLIIALIVLLLFGAKKIPQLFKGLGQGIKEFKDETKDLYDDKEDKK